MSSRDDLFISAADIARRVRQGTMSPVDLVDRYLDRIDDRGDVTNAYVTVVGDDARERAAEIEAAVECGNPIGPLAGVPIGIKDLSATKAGVRHTYGLEPFADNIAKEDATVVKRLESAGAIVLGKTNTPDLGWGDGKTDNPVAGATATPFDPSRTAGGSSGGSAAAVADGLAAAAQGSDAGGSIRIPAACCGVVGVYPSFNRVPAATRPDAFGAHTPFLQAGPLTRTVEDAALMLDAMTGYERADPFSAPDSGSFVDAVERSIEGLSVAYSPTLGLFPVENRVRETVDEAVESLADAGADVELVDPAFEYDRATYREAFDIEIAVTYATMNESFADAGVDLLDHRETLRDRLVRFIEDGQEISAVEYRRTDVIRTSLYDTICDLFEEYDLLVSSTLATVPFSLSDQPPSAVSGESIDPSFDWFLTWPFNMTGHPAASIPAGTVDGLPVGVQLVAPRYRDDRLFTAGAAIERQRPWAGTYPGRGGDSNA